MIVVFGNKIQVIHEAHWRLEARARNSAGEK
jgi:hypothetical protein